VVAAFGAAQSERAARPLFTFYDDASGERTEVSGATLGNWVAKTANLLVDGLGLGPGDVARVDLPPHWQTAAVLLGCWSAGLVVDLDGRSEPAAVAFVTAEAAAQAATESATVDAADVLVFALAPMAAPVRPGPPPGTADFVVEVRRHGDHFQPTRLAPTAPALVDGTTHGALVDTARAAGLPGVERVMIDGDLVTDPAVWLVAPLVAGTSVVLCRHTDDTRREARLATERATPYP
jgi:uncharacterized protein (TIGR03089 family)